MHKKIALLLCMILVVCSFTGCSKVQQSLVQELMKVGEWEAYDIKLTGTLGGQIQNISYDLPTDIQKLDIDITGYVNVTDEYVKLKIKLLEDAKSVLPEIELFITPETICVNKEYLMAQSNANRFDKIGEKYVSWPLTDELEDLASLKKGKKWSPKAIEVLNNITVDMPLAQNGRTYTLSVNHDQIGEISRDYAKGIYAQLDQIIALYLEIIEEEVGVKEKAYYAEYAKEFKEEIDSYLSDGEYFEMMKYFVQGGIYGSYLNMQMCFDEAQVTGTYQGKVQFLKQASVDYDLKLEVKKAAKQKIALPSGRRNLTRQQYESYSYVPMRTFYIAKEYCDTTIEELKQKLEEVNNTYDEAYDDYYDDYYEQLDGFITSKDTYINLYRMAGEFYYTPQYDDNKKQYYLVSNKDLATSNVQEDMNEVLLSFAAGTITEEEYKAKIDTIMAYYEEDDEAEKAGAKRLYVESVTVGSGEYITLSELEKIGFESKKEVRTDEDTYYGAYIYVYGNIEE